MGMSMNARNLIVLVDEREAGTFDPEETVAADVARMLGLEVGREEPDVALLLVTPELGENLRGEADVFIEDSSLTSGQVMDEIMRKMPWLAPMGTLGGPAYVGTEACNI